MKLRFILLMSLLLSPLSAPAGVEHHFDTPSDDVWHYPFNFTPGFRPLGGVFSPAGTDEFNDRDGVIIVAWDTSRVIPAGQPLDSYDIRKISVTVTNFAASFLVPEWVPDLTVDEWFTYYTGNSMDADPGRPIELFGVGFGPTYDAVTWTQAANFVGATQSENRPRDPFPMTFDDLTGLPLHLEDNLRGFHNEDVEPPLCEDADSVCPFTPIPWAVGNPIDYAPGSQQVPFDIQFDVDLVDAGSAVRTYFQNGLRDGRIFISISSLQPTVQQGSSVGYPNFFMKEGAGLDPLGKAPALFVTLASEATGDAGNDGTIGLDDWSFMADCLHGPDLTPPVSGRLTAAECNCFFDFDSDGDVDAADAAVFLPLLDEG